MKSGPTLKPCTCMPRLRKAPRMPSTTEVLPTPLCVPAITRRGNPLRATSAAMLIYHPTNHETQRQTGNARGIHEANRPGNTRDLERPKGVSKIRQHIFYPLVGVCTAEPDTERSRHGRLRNAGIGARVLPAIAPADTPAAAGIAPGEPRPD